MSQACYFISDLHLRQLDAPDERLKQEHLRSFLRHLHGRANQLFVVGDLFDFWFEYRSVVPRRGGRVLAELADLVDDGVSVVLFAGNHDWWIGRVLTEEYGLIVRRDPLRLEAQGKRLYLDHGDGLSVPSRSYDRVRGVLRHPWAIRAFRLVHPDWGAHVARFINRGSHEREEGVSPAGKFVPVYERVAAQAFAAGADIAVFGHVHAARIEARQDGLLVVLGDWITHGTYGELLEGVFRLKTWRGPDLPPWPSHRETP